MYINLETQKVEIVSRAKPENLDKLLSGWKEGAGHESKMQKVLVEFAQKIKKERWELVEKTIESLPTKYDKIIRGTSSNLGVETKTPYFGCNNIFAGEFVGEYIFTTVEWRETTFDTYTSATTMHFKIVYEPQDGIIFDKI